MAGYAAIDALVALLIISLSVIFSLQSIDQTKRVGELAWELRQAQTALSYLLEFAPSQFEASEGQAGDFTWRVQTDETGAEQPIEICRRAATLTSVETGRVYNGALFVTCPQRDPA